MKKHVMTKAEQRASSLTFRAALTMDDVAAALSCSVPTVYRLVSDGHLKTFLIGRKRYASPRALLACVETMEKLQAVLQPDEPVRS